MPVDRRVDNLISPDASSASNASDAVDPLARYWAKRDFTFTSEPRGERAAPGEALSFVI